MSKSWAGGLLRSFIIIIIHMFIIIIIHMMIINIFNESGLAFYGWMSLQYDLFLFYFS